MTRFWPQGQQIEVRTHTTLNLERKKHGLSPNELPENFSWRQSIHQVEEIVEVWRVDIDWWRTRKWRTYFRLTTDTGLLVVIYQDLIGDRWLLQRIYD